LEDNVDIMNEQMKRLFEAAKVLRGIESPSQLALALNASPQSVTNWQKRGPSDEALIDAEVVIGCSPAWVKNGTGSPISKSSPDAIKKMAARFSHSSLVDDAVASIPLLSAVGSMGSGDALTYDGDQIVDHMPISKSWVARNVKGPIESLRIITGHGDSMSPTFRDGDMLLVDTSKTAVDIDGVYVLSAHSRLFIKRVRQRIDGQFEISSDNPTVKTVDILNGETQVTVHGRVVWAWKGESL
jgi:phage repressor protein C with HTH and peptisase S24 domain